MLWHLEMNSHFSLVILTNFVQKCSYKFSGVIVISVLCSQLSSVNYSSNVSGSYCTFIKHKFAQHFVKSSESCNNFHVCKILIMADSVNS